VGLCIRYALVETLRKPSTGLKPNWGVCRGSNRGRDTQKTQHGIETVSPRGLWREERDVETLRKPSTGLKRTALILRKDYTTGRDTQKTQHGIETSRSGLRGVTNTSRDTQKTQHGIETYS